MQFIERGPWEGREGDTQALDAERDSDPPYRLLFDLHPQPMWVFDQASKRMLAVNSAAIARYGYSRGEFLQLTILDIRRTLQGQRLTEAQIDEDPIGSGGLRLTTRWKHALKDGALIDVEVTSSDLPWDGRMARLVVVNEVTDRVVLQQQAQQAMLEMSNARELIDRVIDRVGDAIIALDTDLRFTYLNKPALRLLQRDRAEQLLGRYIWDEYDLAHGRAFHDAYARALRTQQAEVFEAFYAPWDKWIEVRVFPSVEGLSIFCNDITERKNFEGLLLDREREFRLLAEQMPALIYRSGPEPPYPVLYISPYIHTLGYSVMEWLADPLAWSRALHPDDKARVLQALSLAYEVGTEHQIEYRLRNARGEWRHFRDRSRMIESADGRPGYVQGIALDVTDLVESEQALRASEASLRQSEQRYRLAASGGQVWDWDINHDQLSFSPDFWRQLGYPPSSPQRYRGRLAAVVHPGDIRRHREQIVRHLRDRTPFDMDVRVLDVHGKERWLHIKGQAEWNEHGRATYMAGTTVDITQRKRAEDSLRESEAYRRNLFEQLADGVLLVNHENRILDANPQAIHMLGYPAETLLNASIQNLLINQQSAFPVEFLQPGTISQTVLAEWNILCADGAVLPVEVSIRALDQRRCIAVLRDVTDRRAAQRALLTYQVELSELNQRLLKQERQTTRRLAQALHDNLGQTLAVARLNLEALLVTEGASLPPALTHQCQRLAQTLAQAVKDVRQVLADLRPPLLEEQGLAAALDNEVRVTPAVPGTDMLLELGDGMVRQRWPFDVEYTTFMVVREAMANARLHAQASMIRVVLEGDESRLQAEVIDDGAGIDPDVLQGKPGHLGIVGMRERAISIGARFTIAAEPELGTRVRLIWAAPPA